MDKKKLLKEIRSWTIIIVGAFMLTLIINSKVVAKVQVKHSSMEDTLYPKQQLIMEKLSYNFKKPDRGDIIIFLRDEAKGTLIEDAIETIDKLVSIFDKNDNVEENRLVKRVIGIEGDVIDIREGNVYVNDEILEEPYVKGNTTPDEIEFPITVEKNKLFVLGDNRNVSIDSREFGVIDCNQVEGKVIYRIYPFSKTGPIK